MSSEQITAFLHEHGYFVTLAAGDLLPAGACADCDQPLEPRAGNQVEGGIPHEYADLLF